MTDFDLGSSHHDVKDQDIAFARFLHSNRALRKPNNLGVVGECAPIPPALLDLL